MPYCKTLNGERLCGHLCLKQCANEVDDISGEGSGDATIAPSPSQAPTPDSIVELSCGMEYTTPVNSTWDGAPLHYTLVAPHTGSYHISTCGSKWTPDINHVNDWSDTRILVRDHVEDTGSCTTDQYTENEIVGVNLVGGEFNN